MLLTLFFRVCKIQAPSKSDFLIYVDKSQRSSELATNCKCNKHKYANKINLIEQIMPLTLQLSLMSVLILPHFPYLVLSLHI